MYVKGHSGLASGAMMPVRGRWAKKKRGGKWRSTVSSARRESGALAPDSRFTDHVLPRPDSLEKLKTLDQNLTSQLELDLAIVEIRQAVCPESIRTIRWYPNGILLVLLGVKFVRCPDPWYRSRYWDG